MPIYEYANTTEPGCEKCRQHFTRLEKLAAPPLRRCPSCGTAVRRVISAPNVVSGKSHQLRESNIEKAGFTQYRKIGKGVYEKTAGKGPGIIKGDQ